MAITIKRYPNRKLYDTVEKQYITLERIADLIRMGEEIRVVDNASGEDLTAVTLSQIVFELEKKRSGSYPKSLLAGLVQSGGETLDAVRRTLTNPLDLARHIEEEIERRIDLLIAENELTFEEGHRLLEKLIAAGQRKIEGSSVLEKTVGKVLNERGVPSARDLQRLHAQVDTLTRMIEELSEEKRSS